MVLGCNRASSRFVFSGVPKYYAAQFCKGFGAPAKPFRMALGALIIKARLTLTDEELVEQIKENPYLQFFIGLDAFEYAAPFDPSRKIYFR